MMEEDVDDMAIAIDTASGSSGSPMDIDIDVEGEPVEESPEDLDSEADRESDSDSDSEVSIRSDLDQDFVLEEHYENGRRYANNDYFYPNDDIEETRLNIIHQVYLLILKNDLHVSRVPKGIKRILDVGTGPGDWAIAMGERYPGAEVIATDLSTYRPTNTPPNVTFQIDDATHEWTFTEPFDIIHMRDLHGAFADWNWVFAETYKHLAVDGKLEICNAGPIKLTRNYEKSYTALWLELFSQGMAKSGIEWIPRTKKSDLEAAGLRIVKTHTMEIPLGFWSEDPRKQKLGKMALVASLESIEACCLRLLTRNLEWDVEQVRDLCEKVKEELMNPANRPTLTIEFVVARKLPLLPPSS